MNENKLEVYNNVEFGAVRTLETAEGKILFCGADIAKALGYSNSRKALADHCKEKGVTKCDTLTNGGIQALTYIDEGNVYRLITHSKLPNAECFESWVFDEVLLAIRKHGSYNTHQDSYMIDDPVKRAERWFEEQKETSYLLQRQNELEKRIETLEHAQKLTQNPVHTFIKNCCIMRVNYRDGITTTKLYRALRHGAGIIQYSIFHVNQILLQDCFHTTTPIKPT